MKAQTRTTLEKKMMPRKNKFRTIKTTTTTTKNQANKHDPNVNVMQLPNVILTQYL